MCQGSSPRMRGSHPGNKLTFEEEGIIPAYAGLTPGITRLSSRARDHPRVCGAHSARPVNMRMYPGSSPRIRGSPMFTLHYYLTKWIIPAYAGLTLSFLQALFQRKDHPRACGAHETVFTSSARSAGSSPRMRGSRWFFRYVAGMLGIIPAHAGLTSSS